MRSGSELYNIQERPTYEEILQVERRAIQMRNEVLAGLFSSMTKNVGSVFKKALSLNIHHHRKATQL